MADLMELRTLGSVGIYGAKMGPLHGWEPMETGRLKLRTVPTTKPRLERPPVSETVLAVQFQPLASLRSGHFCQFMLELGEGWTVPEESAAIGVTSEPVSDDEIWRPPLPRIEVLEKPGFRWRSSNEDRMIQLENAWLAFNWKRSSSDDDYTHYPERIQDFEGLVERFGSFLTRRDLRLEPTLWEVIYVNEIPQGELWQHVSDWPNVFPTLLSAGTSPSRRLQTYAGHWTWVLESDVGRLHAEISHRRRDETRLLGLKLWARGQIGKEPGGLRHGLGIGHDAIVSTFFEISSEKARQHWGERT